ncbi:MAG: succinate dehydrogenase iron-sulfur subunit [Thaumarchaeota archaeon]|nr:succinate dehydrogenase iron-sulfur subunit [Nitrososphaerota archaeon]
MQMDISILVSRSAPKEHFEEFKIPLQKGMSVLDALIYAKENLDHSIAIRYSCRMAICGSCGMKVNGRAVLACYTQISELKSGEIKVEPLDNCSIIRDLVTDFAEFFSHHKSVHPYLIRKDAKENPVKEFLQKPEEVEKYLQYSYCIKCGLCYSACPTVAADKEFPGPQALVQAYRYIADSRDQGMEKRIDVIDTAHGVARCHFAGTCSSVCPKGIDPAQGIQFLRRYTLSLRR